MIEIKWKCLGYKGCNKEIKVGDKMVVCSCNDLFGINDCYCEKCFIEYKELLNSFDCDIKSIYKKINIYKRNNDG